MTNEERDLITQYIARVSGRAPATQAGSVPATIPPLPPVDADADRLIGDLLVRYPEARYRLTQTAFVQEHALMEAQNRIQQMEWELNQTRQALVQTQQAAQQGPQQGQRSGGFFSGLFGGGARPGGPPPQYAPQPGLQPGPQPGYGQPPPQWGGQPPPQYAPGYQPGMFAQRGGSGFLGSALTTAAGVAGGLVVGNALMNMFSGHGGMGSGMGMGGGGFGAGAMPQGGAGPGAGYVEQSPWSTPDAGAGAGGQGYVDQGSWSTPDAGGGTDQGGGGWSTDDNSGGGGWDGGGGSDDSA
jgi:hypothetical protein